MNKSIFGGNANGDPDLIDLVSEDEDDPSSRDSSFKDLEHFLKPAFPNHKGPDNIPPIETGNNRKEEALQGSPHNHFSDHVAASGTERQPEQGPSLPGRQFNKGPKRTLAQGQCKRKKCPSKHVCYFCQKTFPSPSTLEIHMATHTRDKPFPCTICGKEFSLKGNLDVHLRYHRKEKRFTCNFCEKGFVRKYNLDVHIRMHVKENPFKCNLCGKDFVVKGNLDRHIRFHLKEKWFKCPHPGCTSSFVGGSDLKAHSRVHSGEKPFACSHPGCGKKFTQNSSWNRHMRAHGVKGPAKSPLTKKEKMRKCAEDPCL